MVKLQCYYESEDDIHLVLEYQHFGEIYEIISRIFVDEFAEDCKVRKRRLNSCFSHLIFIAFLGKITTYFFENT